MKLRYLILIAIIASVLCLFNQPGLIRAQAEHVHEHGGVHIDPEPIHHCSWHDEYSTPNTWTLVHTPYEPGTCSPPCATSGPHPGYIKVANEICNFNKARDGGADLRVYKSIGDILMGVNSWKAEFDFQPTEVAAYFPPYYVSHAIFALTAGTLNPINDETSADICCNPSNQDAVIVMYTNNSNPTSVTATDTIGFYIWIKQGISIDQSPGFIKIPVPSASASAPYYLRLERFNDSDYRLSVFADVNRTVHVPSSPICFSSKHRPKDLNVLQHSNNPQGSPNRMLSGILDNTCILKVNHDPCYLPEQIVGASDICCGDQGEYHVQQIIGESVTYLWNVSNLPASYWSGQGTSSITINTEGMEPCPPGLGENDSQIIVTLEVKCRCKTTKYEKVITLHPKPKASCFDIAQSNAGVLTITPCPNTGFNHIWELYHGISPCNSTATQGGPLLTSTSSGQFTFTLPPSNKRCYVLVHGMSPIDSICAPNRVKKHFLVEKGKKLVVKGTEEIKVDVKAFEEKKNEMFLK